MSSTLVRKHLELVLKVMFLKKKADSDKFLINYFTFNSNMNCKKFFGSKITKLVSCYRKSSLI